MPPAPIVYHECAQEFSLNCTAEGLPPPSITWVWSSNNGMEREFPEGFTDDNGRQVNVSNTLHAAINRVDSVFYINSTVDDSCADYTAICRASNYLGGGSKLSESELLHSECIMFATEAQVSK